jgi:hypothetical protein
MKSTRGNSIETDKFIATTLGGGIIENKIKDEVTLDKEGVLEMKRANMSLAQGQKYATIVTVGFLSGITKEARELMATEEFIQDAVAKGLIVETLGHRIAANFYMRVNKPVMLTRVFKSREEALRWVQEEMQKVVSSAETDFRTI